MYEEAFLKINDCLPTLIKYWHLFCCPIASLQIFMDVPNLSQPCIDGSFQTGSKQHHKQVPGWESATVGFNQAQTPRNWAHSSY
jgi:hypothetical protein